MEQDEFRKIVAAEQRPRIFPKIFWTFLIVFFVLFAVIFAKAYNFGNKVFVGNGNFLSRVAGIFAHNRLQGEGNNQINILLLGYGGEGHDGPYLTDSMILASINPQTKLVVLTSIPRDYYWPDSPYEAKKINSAFAAGFGKDGNFTKGGESARKAVEGLSGLDIPYFAAIDFNGFEKAIDRVGGLDIHVDQTFTDTQYPNDATAGYLPPLTFTIGNEHMNGVRALEFARSRHAEGPEGSDFARSRRQEKIITAFKDKVLAMNLLSNAKTLNDLLNIFADHFHTNLEPGEIMRLKDLLGSPDTQVAALSLDPDTGLVCNEIIPPNNEFVIKPCDSASEQKIRQFFAKSTDYAQIMNEKVSVIIEDAGNKVLYQRVKQDLAAVGVQVYEVPYKGLPLTKSVLYEVNSKPATEKLISDQLGIKPQPKPDSIKASSDLVLFVAGE